MVVRRSRFQIKPNVGARAISSASVASHPSTSAAVPNSPAPPEQLLNAQSPFTVESAGEKRLNEVEHPDSAVPPAAAAEEQQGKRGSKAASSSAEAGVPDWPLSPQSPKKVPTPGRGGGAVNAPLTAAALRSPPCRSPFFKHPPVPVASPRSPRKHTYEHKPATPGPAMGVSAGGYERYEAYPQQPSKFSEAQLNKRFSGREVMDPKTFRMSDLVFWNPKQTAKEKNDEDETSGTKILTKRGRKKVRTKHEEDPVSTTKSESAADYQSPQTSSASEWKAPCPQLKIDALGRAVLDEESLTVRQAGEVEATKFAFLTHSDVPKKLSSHSFRRKAPIRTSCPWTTEETDRFYKILMATGPDFTMMHEFFPTRSRDQLLRKYKVESRQNKQRVDDVMRMPGVLDQSLYALIPKDSMVAYRENEPIPVEVIGDGAYDPYSLQLQAEARRQIEEIQAITNADGAMSKYGRKRKVNANVIDVEEQEEIPEGLLADLRTPHQRALQPAVQRMIEDIKKAVHINVEPLDSERSTAKRRYAPYQPQSLCPSIPQVSMIPNTAGGRPVLNLPAGSTFQFLPTPDGDPRQLLVSAPVPSGGTREFVLVHQRAADTGTASDLIHFYMVTRQNDTTASSSAASTPSRDTAAVHSAAFPPVVPREQLPHVEQHSL